MNYGSVSEAIYNRTVAKTIQTFGFHKEDIEKGTGLRADCVLLPIGAKTASSQGQASGKDALVVYRAAQDAVNRLLHTVVEADRVQVSLQIILSEQLREAKLRNMLEEASIRLAQEKVEIIQTKVQVVPNVQTAIATANAVAYSDEPLFWPQGAKPGEDIVMTKWLGLETTAVLADRHQTELATRYPLRLIEDAMSFSQYLSTVPEAAVAAKSSVSAVQVVRDGGIFGGLWELAQSNDVGLVVDLKKIPVKQETIEVCEFFDINPYKVLSGGSLLVTTKQGADLVERLADENIAAAVIGKTNDSNDRIIRNDDEIRYLEPAREDDYYKVAE